MKKIISGILVTVMLLIMLPVNIKEVSNIYSIEDASVPFFDGGNSSNSLDFVKNMGAGWNLGNSFCCYDNSEYGLKSITYYENLWGNPVTQKTMIDELKNKGFKTIRIPVTYRNHIDSNKHIDEKWLQRLKQVVDYVIDNEMYCIINTHHEDWLVADEDKKDSGNEELEFVWTQIAEYFGNYDNHLMFEGFNEVINAAGQWDSASASSYEVVNSFNQTFVNAVRKTGGKNSDRYLIVKPYAAKATKSVVDGFVLPTDTADDKLIISVHIYDGMANAPQKLDYLYNKFIAKGIPVIVGEWGRQAGTNEANTEKARAFFAKNFVCVSNKYGIPCIWWDDGGITDDKSNVKNFAIFQRQACTWYFEEIVDSIVSNTYLHDDLKDEIGESNVEDDIFAMTNFLNWRPGEYSSTDCAYMANSKRICLKTDVRATTNSTYTAKISDSRYHILVYIKDDSDNLIKQYNLANGDSFIIDNSNYKMYISLYDAANTNTTRFINEYKSLFENGFIAYLVEQNSTDITNDAVELDYFAMTNINNWQTGDYYSPSNRKTSPYTENKTRICLIDWPIVTAGQKFVANISDNNYHILVRQIDANGEKIAGHNLANGDSFTIQGDTRTLRIGIYHINDNKSGMTFDSYKDLFEKGFRAYLSKEVEDDFWGMSDIRNWQTGDYYSSSSRTTSPYTENETRICLIDWPSVESGQIFNVHLSDTNFRILVRQIDENGKKVSGHILTDGNSFIISDEAKSLRIGLYNLKDMNSAMTYDKYVNLFQNGFEAYISK